MRRLPVIGAPDGANVSFSIWGTRTIDPLQSLVIASYETAIASSRSFGNRGLFFKVHIGKMRKNPPRLNARGTTA